jgi:enoyl-CoA hydratase/carnithine racemase
MAEIQAERFGAIQVLRIDNEAKRNAFTHDMTRQLGEELQRAEADPAIRCVIITGAGDVAFSSGHDLREMLADRAGASAADANDPFMMPARMMTPTIAAINGSAYAVGFILALNCDLRVGAENAVFAAPGARIGLLPIAGQISRLPALLPHSVAYDMLVTCREMRMEEAARLGFVATVTPRGDSLSEAMRIGERIAANSSHVIAEIKRGLETRLAQGMEEASRFEWAASRVLHAGPHAEEGIRAFLEKRRPNFA